MPVTVPEHAKEGSTFPVVITPTYTSGTVTVGFKPNTALWTLSDTDGTIINSRSGVSLTAASSMNIVLKGDDLAITGTVRKTVKLLVEGTYNSTTYGNDLPYTEEATIIIDNLVNKP